MELIKLKNKKMEVTLCDIGASIFRLMFDGQDMLVSPSGVNVFLRKNLYFGKTIGRICGRIKNDNGEIILHGGRDGLSNQKFDYVESSNKVTFTYMSVADQSSQDGRAIIKVIYSLLDSGLLIEFEVTAIDSATISLTNHSYFCLGEDNNEALSIKMDSDKCFVYDEKLYPLGTNQIGNKFDFRNEYPVRQYGDVDTYFFIKEKPIILRGNRYLLEIDTNYEGAVVYTDNFEDDAETFASKRHKYRGVAIEPQMDAFKSIRQ